MLTFVFYEDQQLTGINMKLQVFIAAIAFACVSALCTQRLDADTIYDIAPYTLSNGYEIVGGSITTDGTTGRGQTEFVRTNILDYEIIVTGPINFTFTPARFGASIFSIDSGMVVTDTGIWIEPSDAETQDFRIEAREPGINVLSRQQVVWVHGPIGNDSSSVAFVAGGGTDQGTFRLAPRVDRLLIAGSLPAAVPEPAAGLLIAGIVLVGTTRRYRFA